MRPLDTGASPTSADQVAARHIGQETPLPSLELALEAGESIAYRTPTTPLPMETNPRVVFERLFGDGSTPEERAARQRQFASLLDAVAGEVAPLQRDLPAADRERLDRYLTDIRELERRLALAADSSLADLDVPDKPNGIPADFEEHAMLMFDLLALAWQADLTRVATFLVARELSNRLYPRSGVNEGFHNCSHHSEVPANIERLAQLNEYHTRTTIAYFLQKLADTPDGDGTLLDHSLVVYGSGMSNPNQHDHHPLPMLLAGGGSGLLRRAAPPRRRRHAVREPARDGARQARRAGRVVRRQHGRGRDLSAAEMACARCGLPRDRPSCALLALAACAARRARGAARAAADDVPASPLAEAAQRGDAAAVRALLDAGARRERAGPRRHAGAALGRARRRSRDGRAARCEPAPTSTPPNRYGVTPLELAIEAGDAALTRWLLDAGADAAAPIAPASRRYCWRARVGDPDVAAALLEHGAAVDARDELRPDGADDRGARRARRDRRRLLDAGADVDARRTPKSRRGSFRRASRRRACRAASASSARAGPTDRGKRFPAGGAKTPLSVRGARRPSRRRARCSSSTARTSSSPTATASRRCSSRSSTRASFA